jgi:hypothetical protein
MKLGQPVRHKRHKVPTPAADLPRDEATRKFAMSQ